MNSDTASNTFKDLSVFIYKNFGTTLGAWPIPNRRTNPFEKESIADRLSPISIGLFLGLIYAALFCVIPFLIFSDPPKILINISAWTSLYLAITTILVRLTASSVYHTIENSVIPNLTEPNASDILKELKGAYGGNRPHLVCIFAAVVLAIISGLAIKYDYGNTMFPRYSRDFLSLNELVESQPNNSGGEIKIYEIFYFCAGLFFIFLVNIRTMYMAEFYKVFFRNLTEENIFALSPFQSSHIQFIEIIGKRILLFWLFILICFSTILMFTELENFVYVLLFVYTICTFTFATVVYLECERYVNLVATPIANATLFSLEKEIAKLYERRQDLNDLEWEKLEKLSSTQRSLSSKITHKSTLFGAISIISPFIPIVALALNWLIQKFIL